MRPAASAVEHPFDLDADDVLRFEVSGISEDDEGKVSNRVRDKLSQVRSGNSLHPGLVGVVGFRTARVVLRRA